MPDAASLELLRAIAEAHELISPWTGQREPVLYAQTQQGSALSHHARPPGTPWPRYDEAMIRDLYSQGYIRVSDSDVTPTERGRSLVAQLVRTSIAEPVADLAGIVAALNAQTDAEDPHVWSAVRPLLSEMQKYWHAGGFSAHGIQMRAIAAAVPERQRALFRATVVALVDAGYLQVTTDLVADGLPLEVEFTDSARAVLQGWPGATPNELFENLIAVLGHTAEAEPDQGRRRGLQAVIKALRDIGVDVAGQALAQAMLPR